MQACFLPADILLPDDAADFEKWAVVACDQFTSQPEYWRKAAEIVGDAPSTLNLVYPEAYLAEGDARIAAIRQAMEDYMRRGMLETRVKDGFVLVRRVTESGERLGLVGRLDLEQYDFTPGTSAPVRATEGTILSRIPPRVRIRQGASIESPHAMMLIDDAAMRLIEPLADRELPKLYDTELMLGGGHIAGYAVEGELAARTVEQIARYALLLALRLGLVLAQHDCERFDAERLRVEADCRAHDGNIVWFELFHDVPLILRSKA